jgi:hypothetical protein
VTAVHETIYPRLRSNLTTAELIRLYTPTPEDRALADRVTKGTDAHLTFCLLLKTFQCLGSFVQLRHVPEVIVQHLAQVLSAQDMPSLAAYDASGTRRRHIQAIRDALQVRPYDRDARRQIIRSMAEAAVAKEDLADLINIGIAELFRLRYELPGFTTLDKIAQRVRAAVYRAYYRMVFATLGATARATIDRWFIADPMTLASPWQTLKQDSDRPSVQHLRDLAERLVWFDQQAIARNVLAGIPDVKVAHFAAEARTLDAARMKDMQEAKRYTLAVALYAKQAARTRDDLAEMLRLMSPQCAWYTTGHDRFPDYRYVR